MNIRYPIYEGVYRILTYEISMVESAGAFATDALVGAVKRGVVGGGAKADLLDILLLGQFRETAV